MLDQRGVTTQVDTLPTQSPSPAPSPPGHPRSSRVGACAHSAEVLAQPSSHTATVSWTIDSVRSGPRCLWGWSQPVGSAALDPRAAQREERDVMVRSRQRRGARHLPWPSAGRAATTWPGLRPCTRGRRPAYPPPCQTRTPSGMPRRHHRHGEHPRWRLVVRAVGGIGQPATASGTRPNRPRPA